MRALFIARRWLAALALAVPLLPAAAAAGERQPHPPLAAKARAPAAAPAAPAGSFTIEPVPEWVKPAAPGTPDPNAGAAVQLLLVDRQVRLDGRGQSRYVGRMERVDETAGLESAAHVTIDFDPSYERLALHAVVVRRGERRIDKLDARQVKLLQRETQLERQVVDGRLTASLVLDDVRVGDVVEVAYTLHGANPVFEGRFVDRAWMAASAGPVARVQYRLLAPEPRRIALKAPPTLAEVTRRVSSGWRETVVRREHVPQFVYDPSAPEAQLLDEQLELSEFADWAEVSAWAARTFAPRHADAPALKAEAERLAAAAGPEPAQRVRHTLDFVQTAVRYFGTESGPNSHRPADPARVLQQRFGDCKDKSALLVALLKLQGIAAQPLLVSTRFGDEVPKQLPTPLAFDHAVASVQLDGLYWVLDGTRAFQSGPVPQREALGLGHGLPVQAEGGALRLLPPQAGVLQVDALDRIEFGHLDEDPVLVLQKTYYRDAAEGVRARLAQQPRAELEKQLLSLYARYYRGAEVVEPLRVEELDGQNAVRATLRLKLRRYLRAADDYRMTAEWALPSLIETLRPADLAPRSKPLRLPEPGIYRHAVELRFEEPVFPPQPLQRVDEGGEGYAFAASYQTTPQSAQVRAELQVREAVLPAADWPAYSERWQRLWPRLNNTLAVPTVAPERAEALKQQLAALRDALEQRRAALRTARQVDAQMKLWLLEQRLASGRVPPHLRLPLLMDQGNQLATLGRLDDAKQSYGQVLALDARHRAAHTALALNALLRGDDAEATAQADEVLAQSPDDASARMTRAYAALYAGRADEGRDELAAVLRGAGSAVERGYAALWLPLASKRFGAAGVDVNAASVDGTAWPGPLVRWMFGRGTLESAMAAARADEREAAGRVCELNFYFAQLALAEGQREQARAAFQRAVDTGAVEYLEHALARRELARLDGAARRNVEARPPRG